MENEIQHTDDLKRRCGSMAPVLKQLFIARIITIAAPIISIIFALASFSNGPASTMFIAMIIVLAANVFYIIVLFRLGKYHDDFKFAAIISILSPVFSTISRTLSNEPGLVVFISLLSAGLSLLLLWKFSNAMISSFERVDLALTSSWESYRTWTIGFSCASMACFLLAFVPGINILAAIGGLVCAIGLLVLMIWEIVLIYNSYQSMEAYSKQPDQVPPTATEKTTAAVIGGVIQRT